MSSLRVMAMSDTHSLHDQIDVDYYKNEDIDVFIYAGDWNITSLSDVEDLDRWMYKVPAKFKLWIAGNHDLMLEYKMRRNLERQIHESCKNCVYLRDTGIQIGGVNFYGFPWTPLFNNWAFMMTEEGIEKKISYIPKNTDVLISHGPAHGILDRTERGDLAGCRALYEKCFKKLDIRYHVHGHIHEGFGNERLRHRSGINGITEHYNVSVVNENYNVVHRPTIFNVEVK